MLSLGEPREKEKHIVAEEEKKTLRSEGGAETPKMKILYKMKKHENTELR